ncbi:MAG: hypothetical protein ACXWLH_01295 [Candidatus Saccharimonadales bacterium]
MKLTKLLVATAFCLLFGIIATAYLLQQDLLSNILYLIAPFLAICCGVYTVRTFKLSNITGQIFGLLTAGLTSFFIGELLFFYYQFISHSSPFPSAADFFYLLGYPLMFAGFIRAAFNHRVRWHNFSKLYLFSILLLLAVLAILVAYFGVYLAYNPGDSGASNFISIAYGIGDLILIVPSLFILKIIMDFRGGKLFNSWVMILIALAFMLSGDLMFAIYRNSYTALKFPYTLIDLAYVANYLLFGFSFFYTAHTIRQLNLRLKK